MHPGITQINQLWGGGDGFSGFQKKHRTKKGFGGELETQMFGSGK